MELDLTKFRIVPGEDIDRAVMVLDEMDETDVDLFWTQIDFQLKHGRQFWNAVLKPWYRRRTTGEGSQNNHVWGHATQIAAEHGCSARAIISWAERYAMDHFGYPCETVGTDRIPRHHSETDTKECGLLIDALHIRAAQDNIRLKEKSEW